MLSKTYKRKNGLFVTCLWIDGRRTAFSAKTKTASREKAEEAWLRLKKGQPLKDTADTLGEWIDQWMVLVLKASNRKRAIKPTTLAWYQRMIRVHIRPQLGDLKLAKLQWTHVQEWVNQLEDSKDPRTVHAAYSLLKRILAAAVPDRVPYNACDDRKVSLTPKVAKEKVPMTAEQQDRFFAAADQSSLRVFYRTMFMLGLRKGEALGLKWSDIDRDAKDGAEIKIQRTVASWHLDGEEYKTEFLEPKTAKSKRPLPLVPALLKLLDAHRAAQERYRRHPVGKGKVVRMRQWEDHDLIFPSNRGTPIGESNVNRHMAKVLKAAGLPGDFHPHLMRHGTASEMLRRGASLKEVSEFLGHSQIGITANLYGHVNQEQKRDAAQAMADHMAELGKVA